MTDHTTQQPGASAPGQESFARADLSILDPIIPAAQCLQKINDSMQRPMGDIPRALERALAHHVVRVEEGDFSGMHAVLISQTHMLHRLFAKTVEKYLDTPSDVAVLYGHIALKAQIQCRQTLDSLHMLKNNRQALAPYEYTAGDE